MNQYKENGIKLRSPIDEQQVKTLLLNQFIHDRISIRLNTKDIPLSDILKITMWADEFNCDVIVEDEFTIRILGRNQSYTKP